MSQIKNCLKEKGYTLISEHEYFKDKSALTNDVWSILFANASGERRNAIVKISRLSREPREIKYMERIGKIGGWISNRLENETRLLTLVNKAGINSPKPLIYKCTNECIEILMETQLVGQQSVILRPPNVGMGEYVQMEKDKGKILAQINNVSSAKKTFGSLDVGSTEFTNWKDYFLTKFQTTIIFLRESYGSLVKLKYFDHLAQKDLEWQLFLTNVVTFYSSPVVSELLLEDNIPTVSHGDFWDGNLIGRMTGRGSWDLSVIDFDRGGIEGKSFDLALWLSSKTISKKQANPIKGVPDFIKGYQEAGGIISKNIEKYAIIYGLWQYLDFLLIDTIYNIDRTNKSVREIMSLYSKMEALI